MTATSVRSSVYLGAEAARRLRAAQAVVDEHAVDAASDRCTRCDLPSPCDERRAALVVLGSYGCLPRRRPGATRPEGIGGQGASGPSFAWLVSETRQQPVGRHRQSE